MKKEYRSPQLVEYGQLSEITLGGGGTASELLGTITIGLCAGPTFTQLVGGVISTLSQTSCSVVSI